MRKLIGITMREWKEKGNDRMQKKRYGKSKKRGTCSSSSSSSSSEFSTLVKVKL